MSEEDFDHIKEYWEMCEKHSVEAVNAGLRMRRTRPRTAMGEYDTPDTSASAALTEGNLTTD